MSNKCVPILEAMRRTQKQKTRKAKGGKFIYSGAYGCTFSPALKCVGQNTRKNKYISKLINYNEAQKEWVAADRVRGLNKGFKYFVYPDEYCRPDKPNATNEYGKCPLPFKDPVLLHLPHGGVDLLHINVPFSEIPAFFEGFLNIFDGLALLHTNNVAHRDIKIPNIVGQKLNSGAYNLRLIDFGLSRPFPHLIKFPKTDNYAYWSYDMRYLLDTFSPSKGDIDDFISTMDYLDFPKWIYMDDKGQHILNLKFGLNLMKQISDGGDAAKLHMIAESEVFALGRTLSDAFVLHVGYISMTSTSVVKMDMTKPDVEPALGLAFYALIQKMCAPDPFQRISLMEAKAGFEALIPLFKTSFKGP